MKYRSIILSSVRIYATLGIFLFHLFGMFGIPNNDLDKISILIFCFLTGYLLNMKHQKSSIWLKNKLLSILIPYWLVIIPALILNRVFEYKNTSIITDIITLLGGNLFLDTKVYVIAWYITFIILLYFFMYVESFSNHILIRCCVWISGFILFALLHKLIYFVAFAAGIFLSKLISPPPKPGQSDFKLSKVLFKTQGYCYAFFLMHGGILVLLIHVLKLNFTQSAIYGMILSLAGTIILHSITEELYRFMRVTVTPKN